MIQSITNSVATGATKQQQSISTSIENKEDQHQQHVPTAVETVFLATSAVLACGSTVSVAQTSPPLLATTLIEHAVQVVNDSTVAVEDIPLCVGTSGTTTPDDVLKSWNNNFDREDTVVFNVIRNNPITIASGHPTVEEMDDSVEQMNALITMLQDVPSNLFHKGVSPGFETMLSPRQWLKNSSNDIYETLPSVNVHNEHGPPVPVPSPANTIRYFTAIRDIWVERKRCLVSMGGKQSTNWQASPFCMCVSAWSHLRGDLLWQFSNQCLEQDMVREASLATTARFQNDSQEWDRSYAETLCPNFDQTKEMYAPSTGVRIMLDRADYLETFISLALQAKHSIDVSTCYLFSECPAQRYILLDLLPYIARCKGVKVRLLCDMKSIEARILMAAMKPKTRGFASTAASVLQGAPEWAFVDHLPHNAPAVSKDTKELVNAMELFPKVLELAHSIPNGGYEIKWWCARDAQKLYRIKSHVKCVVFDGSRICKGRTPGMALLGGSNLCPKAIDSDLDVLIGGDEIVDKVGETFEWLWNCMCAESFEEISKVCHENEHNDDDTSTSTVIDNKFVLPPHKRMAECRVAYVRCEAANHGKTDHILRNVLGAIASAQESIVISTGHINFPRSVTERLAKAVQRGVRVQVLVNSFASCDLRINQKDLFTSLKTLLDIAPGVEVWSTALRPDRSGSRMSSHDDQPDYAPFLHSKYTVVDAKWSALGSWNLWTRCAFYEIEHELFIESQSVAHHLMAKFEKETTEWCTRIESITDCNFYCPKGCAICKPFGPFFVDE